MRRLKASQFESMNYPYIPAVGKTDTSRKSAPSVYGVKALQNDTLKALKKKPLTADEVADKIKRDKLAVRPRITELRAQGKIADTGTRRRNGSGKPAIVWRAISESISTPHAV